MSFWRHNSILSAKSVVVTFESKSAQKVAQGPYVNMSAWHRNQWTSVSQKHSDSQDLFTEWTFINIYGGYVELFFFFFKVIFILYRCLWRFTIRKVCMEGLWSPMSTLKPGVTLYNCMFIFCQNGLIEESWRATNTIHKWCSLKPLLMFMHVYVTLCRSHTTLWTPFSSNVHLSLCEHLCMFMPVVRKAYVGAM